MTTLLISAINFAAEQHRLQRRKDKDKNPYINHPIEVMYILSSCGVTDTDTLCAAVLHDTLEDTCEPDTESTTAFTHKLTQLFNENVSLIVTECSDDKLKNKVDRKKLQISHSSDISDEAKLVKGADKFSNLNGLFTNPPTKWSLDEIAGYFVWSYHVFRNIKGVNQLLDQKLVDLFDKFELDGKPISKLTDEELSTHLENYYKNIDKSD